VGSSLPELCVKLPRSHASCNMSASEATMLSCETNICSLALQATISLKLIQIMEANKNEYV